MASMDRITEPDPLRRERVRDYFGREAHTYSQKSSRGLWAWMRRLETPVVMELLQAKRGEAILDAGCGSGHYTQAIMEAGPTVTAMDIEPAMIDAIRNRLHVETILGDLMTVQLEPRFDKIVCAGVLEFVQEPGAVVANLSRGLRPGGTIVILVLARCLPGVGYWIARRTNGISMPMFSLRGVESLARGAGLHVQQARRAGYNWVARLSRDQ